MLISCFNDKLLLKKRIGVVFYVTFVAKYFMGWGALMAALSFL